jgi:hypothetical protein
LEESWEASLVSKSASKVFPGFDRIFYLGEPGNSVAFRGRLDAETDAFGLTRAEMQPPHPLQVDWAMGRAKPVEVIRTTLGTVAIIADSVVQLLRAHGFTGWSLYEVSVRDKQGQGIPGYSGLSVTGRCGELDHSMSIEVPRIRPGGIFPVWKGLFFEPESWDGSDFFMPAQRFGFVFVVEEVKKALERSKVRNVEFTPLDQFERSWKL